MFRVWFGARPEKFYLSPNIYLYLDDLSGLCLPNSGWSIVIRDDLFHHRSVSYKNFTYLHKEVYWLDMAINFNKSCCWSMVPWMDTIRYLAYILFGSNILNVPCFTPNIPSIEQGASQLHLGKIGRIASKESIVQLIKGKFMPILCLKTCPLKMWFQAVLFKLIETETEKYESLNLHKNHKFTLVCRLHNVVCCQHAAWNAAQNLVIYYVNFIHVGLNILWVQPVVQPPQTIDRRQPPIYTVDHKKEPAYFSL